MKKQTVLNVVIHQGGGFRFGVICGEYLDNPPEKIIIRNLVDSGDLELSSTESFYIRGSIYSKEISEWISRNGYGRTAADNMHLFKFNYERKKGVDVFEYVATSEFVKAPKNQALILPDGTTQPYKKEELIEFVWKDKEWIEKITAENTVGRAVEKVDKKLKIIIFIMIAVAFIMGEIYSRIGFEPFTPAIIALAVFFLGSRIVVLILYHKNL